MLSGPHGTHSSPARGGFPPGTAGAAEQPTQGLSQPLWGSSSKADHGTSQQIFPAQNLSTAKSKLRYLKCHILGLIILFRFYNTKLSLQAINTGVLNQHLCWSLTDSFWLITQLMGSTGQWH